MMETPPKIKYNDRMVYVNISKTAIKVNDIIVQPNETIEGKNLPKEYFELVKPKPKVKEVKNDNS